MKANAAEQLRTLGRVLNANWIVDWRVAIDGGVNLGDWTETMAERFPTVHAFEPGDDLVEALGRRFSGRPGVVLHHAGLWRQAGRCSLVTPPKRDSKRSRYIVPGAGDIATVALDELALDGVGLIKLDLEGAERDALIGAKETIGRCRPVLILEVDRHGERFGADAGTLLRLVAKLGYREVLEARPDRVFAPVERLP